jgi:hypothetical protein
MVLLHPILEDVAVSNVEQPTLSNGQSMSRLASPLVIQLRTIMSVSTVGSILSAEEMLWES